MAGKKLSNDPRTEATRVAIIEAAESLFADAGIDGVSLRQIGSVAGSSNPGVVVYHFKDKAGLLDAIFHYRLPAIDRRRGELLKAIECSEEDSEKGHTALLALLRALWLPLLEQVDSDGRHSYARFMGALIRSDWGGRRMMINDNYPETMRLSALIKKAMPVSSRDYFAERMNMSAIMITGTLQRIDQLAAVGKTSKKQQALLFNDALTMTSAAVGAPSFQ